MTLTLFDSLGTHTLSVNFWLRDDYGRDACTLQCTCV